MPLDTTTDEQKQIVTMIRDFVKRDIEPAAVELERSDTYPAEIVEKMKGLGLFGTIIAPEYGGMGLNTATYAMVMEEISKGWMSVAGIIGSHLIMAYIVQNFGTEEQKRHYLPKMATGEMRGGVGISEPNCGSDVAAIETYAARDGDDYVVNGTKHFISHADLADYTILFAATGEEETPRGPKKLITSFLVDHDTPGLEVAPGYNCVSNRGYHNMILNFDDCRVPASKVLGEEHRGFDVANEWLGATRLQVAAISLGRADRAFRVALEWAADREQFGQKIGKFQAVSFKLADMQTKMLEAELMTYRAAWLMDQGRMTDGDAAMAKISATEMLQFVADEAIQVLGGMGLMDELPLERIWRDARVDRIWDGTSEIQRHIVSRQLLRPLGA